MPSLCAIQHSPSAWANFVPKLTSPNTVHETKKPVKAHVACLLHVLTHALDHGVEILADVFNTCSAEPRSPLNAWLGRSLVFQLGTWPSKPTDSEMPSISCCTTLTSLIKLTAASSSAATTTMSFLIHPELRAGHKTSSSRSRRVKNGNCPRQSAFVETDHELARRLASNHLSWSPSARLGCPRYRCCCRLAWPPIDSNDVFC